MITVSNQRIRLALDVTQWFATPTDIITSASPILANNSDLQFELAFSYGTLSADAQLASMSNWASVQLTLKDFNDIDGGGYWSKTLSNTDLNNGLTFAQWQAGTSQHCVVPITNAQNSIAFSGQSNNYWLVVEIITGYPIVTTTATFSTGATSIIVGSATGLSVGQNLTGTNIAAGTQVTSISGTTIGISIATTGNSSGNYNFQLPATQFPAMAFPVTVKDTGVGSTPPVFVTPDQYYTQAQSDARFALAVNINAKVNKAGDTMTGALILVSTQMTGATGVYATTKTYVDAGDAATAAASVPIAGSTTITGAKTFSALLTASSGLTVSGTITLGSLSGVLKATAGVVSGSATTTDLTEGTNLYHTDARTRNAVLTGYVATSGTVAATDTVLQAIQKLGSFVTNAFVGATVWPVATNSAMLALSSAKKGDFAFRTDINQVFVLGSGSPALSGSWSVVLYPVTSTLTSSIVTLVANNLAGGTVSVTTDNIPEGATNLYFTNARAIATTLTGFSSGAGIISALDTIVGAIGKLNGNISAINPLTTVLAGYSSTTGTISTSDTILSAINKLNGNTAALGSTYAALAAATFTGTVKFSGTTNPGLIINQLSAGQIGALSTSSGNYGNIVYDTTNNLLKALVGGSFVTLQGGLPLVAGSGNPLTGILYFQDGLSSFLHLGNSWLQRSSDSNDNYDFQYNTTTVLTLENSTASVSTVNGWSFNTTTAYQLGGTNLAYLTSTRPVVDWSGNWTVTTTGSYAKWEVRYSGSPAFSVNQDLSVNFHNEVTGNNSFDAATSFKVGGTQVLGARVTGYTDPTGSLSRGTFDTSTVTTAQLAAFVRALYVDLKAHGAIGN